MAMNRRFFRRRVTTRAKRNYHWHRELITASGIAANTTGTQNIIEAADYSNNAALSPSGVTLYRVVLDVDFMTSSATPAAGQSNGTWGISAADTDVAAFTPGDAVAIIDERWLALGSWNVQLYTAVGDAPSYHLHVDTRVRVKLQDTSIRFHFFNRIGAVNPIDCRGIVSLLIAGDTT